MIASRIIRAVSIGQICGHCRCQYHRTVPVFVRGSNFNNNLVPVKDVPKINVDIKPSDLISPGPRHPEEITIDEYKSFNVEDVQTEPFKMADPEFIDEMGPELPISFNVASFVDRNDTMKQLVKLGVDLSVLEQDRNVVDFLLTADFTRDIAPFIQFFVDVGIKPSKIGSVITRHPLIFHELIDNLRRRIDNLEHKKFTKQVIVKIIERHPPYLSKTVKEVDSRLGFVQKEFKLSPFEVRHVLREFPKLVDLDSMKIRETSLTIKEDMGFDAKQMTKMVVQCPSLLDGDRNDMVAIFDLLYNNSKVEHEVMVNFPEVFKGQFSTVSHRLNYLIKTKRDQFDPCKPRFIPLSVLSDANDELFVKKYARTDLKDFDYFLKHN